MELAAYTCTLLLVLFVRVRFSPQPLRYRFDILTYCDSFCSLSGWRIDSGIPSILLPWLFRSWFLIAYRNQRVIMSGTQQSLYRWSFEWWSNTCNDKLLFWIDFAEFTEQTDIAMNHQTILSKHVSRNVTVFAQILSSSTFTSLRTCNATVTYFVTLQCSHERSQCKDDISSLIVWTERNQNKTQLKLSNFTPKVPWASTTQMLVSRKFYGPFRKMWHSLINWATAYRICCGAPIRLHGSNTIICAPWLPS